jgi:hypothetical protein
MDKNIWVGKNKIPGGGTLVFFSITYRLPLSITLKE